MQDNTENLQIVNQSIRNMLVEKTKVIIKAKLEDSSQELLSDMAKNNLNRTEFEEKIKDLLMKIFEPHQTKEQYTSIYGSDTEEMLQEEINYAIQNLHQNEEFEKIFNQNLYRAEIEQFIDDLKVCTERVFKARDQMIRQNENLQLVFQGAEFQGQLVLISVNQTLRQFLYKKKLEHLILTETRSDNKNGRELGQKYRQSFLDAVNGKKLNSVDDVNKMVNDYVQQLKQNQYFQFFQVKLNYCLGYFKENKIKYILLMIIQNFMNRKSLEELSKKWLELWLQHAVEQYTNPQNEFFEKIETITKRAFFRQQFTIYDELKKKQTYNHDESQNQKNICWIDSQINNYENKGYIKNQLSKYKIKTFTNDKEAQQFFNSLNDQRSWLVICPSNQDIVKNIHHLNNVKVIMIFTYRVEETKKWSHLHKKVDGISQYIEELIWSIELYTNEKQSIPRNDNLIFIQDNSEDFISIIQSINEQVEQKLSGSKEANSSSQVQNQQNLFCQQISELQIEQQSGCPILLFDKHLIQSFKVIMKLYLSTFTVTTDDLFKELRLFNPQKEQEIKRILKNKQNETIWNLCYLYCRENLIFVELNKAYANCKYWNVKYTSAFFYQSVINRKQEFMMRNSSKTLYRGIIEETNMKLGEVYFFPAPTSTSLNLQVAQNFAGHEGTIFEIHLHPKDPHLHISILKRSENPGEQEILLIPYFTFQVIGINKNSQVKHIIIEQDIGKNFYTDSISTTVVKSIYGLFK